MRKRFVVVLFTYCFLSLVGALLHAANIDWQPAFDIETEADIDLSGTIVRAINVSTLDPEFDIVEVTIGNQTIEFIGQHTFESDEFNFVSGANAAGSATGDGTFYSGQDQALTTDNEDLDRVLDSHGWVSGGNGVIAGFLLEELTPGQSYQIQLIGAADDRGCCEARRQVGFQDTMTFDDLDTNGDGFLEFDDIENLQGISEFFGRQTDIDDDGEPGPGSVIGFFTAEGSEQLIQIAGLVDIDGNPGNDPGMSAYLLSEVTLGGAPRLQAGDADQDLDFDQLDLVQVQIAAKYLSGQPATWGEGDWDGAPGGEQGNPPAGDGVFSQLDIIAALNAGTYLTGPYAALGGPGTVGDAQTSIVYNAGTGEVSVDAPTGAELTSINIDSASGIFTGDAAQNLGGSFDNDADNNIFKATFGSSFGSLSFGNVAQAGLSEEFVRNDLTAVGSLAGGGDLGNVDLVYVPEPCSVVLLGMGLAGLLFVARRSRCRS